MALVSCRAAPRAGRWSPWHGVLGLHERIPQDLRRRGGAALPGPQAPGKAPRGDAPRRPRAGVRAPGTARSRRALWLRARDAAPARARLPRQRRGSLRADAGARAREPLRVRLVGRARAPGPAGARLSRPELRRADLLSRLSPLPRRADAPGGGLGVVPRGRRARAALLHQPELVHLAALEPARGAVVQGAGPASDIAGGAAGLLRALRVPPRRRPGALPDGALAAPI